MNDHRTEPRGMHMEPATSTGDPLMVNLTRRDAIFTAARNSTRSRVSATSKTRRFH